MAVSNVQQAAPASAGVATDVADTPLLEIEDIVIRYGTHAQPAVDGASLVLRRGEKVAIVGESGSGKTTLAMAIAGFLSATSDAHIQARSFQFDGKAIETRPQVSLIPRRRPGVAVVFQDAMTSLDPVWTVGSQLCAVLRNAGHVPRRSVKTVAGEWLQRVGITDPARVMKSRPYELSGGMRQRVMIALAMSSRPRLLIADEPTSALDAVLSIKTMELLQELVESEGTSLLIVSHDVVLCQRYADRIVVMYKGQIVDQGRPDVLERDSTHPYTRGLLACVPTLDSVDLARLPTLADFMDLDDPADPLAEVRA